MAGLGRRLERLEDATGGECQTCAEKTPIIVVWGDVDPDPEPCLGCGLVPVYEEIEWTT